MKIAARHLKRYKEIAQLLWKYGHSNLVQQMGISEGLETEAVKTATGPTPDDLANDLEAMGPAYIKLAQILSSRSDLLPEPYVQALARLQDNVKPFPYGEVERIVTDDLGVRISKAFSSFEREPIAAASLGQVHRATLREGRAVVVKVQRPGIQQQIADDFEILSQIAGFLDAHTDLGRKHRFVSVLEEFQLTIQQELDYQREAQNLRNIGENLEEFQLIYIPQPVSDYCSRRVLTMDYVQGRKITALGPLARLEMRGRKLAEELFRAYLKQVLVDGLFHADPHPGNVFLTDDGRIALLDLGMVGHTTPGMQENLLKLLLAVSERDAEEASDTIIRISQTTEQFDRAEFKRRLGQIMVLRQDRGLEQLEIGKTLLQVSQTAADNGLSVPSELSLLGKTLLQLDEVGKILDPEFDPNASIRRNVTELISQQMSHNFSQGGIFRSLVETQHFFRRLPSRLNKIMSALTNSELEVKIKAVDAQMVVDGIQKIANRITAGIILASLIVGAALLMRVETSFRIFGYPGLAMFFFLAAAAGGFWLLLSIFNQDRNHGKKH